MTQHDTRRITKRAAATGAAAALTIGLAGFSGALALGGSALADDVRVYTVEGQVWIDKNTDGESKGVQDDGDVYSSPDLKGITVTVTGDHGLVDDPSVKTGEDGKYSIDFPGDPDKKIVVKLKFTEGYKLTDANQGSDNGKDSDFYSVSSSPDMGHFEFTTGESDAEPIEADAGLTEQKDEEKNRKIRGTVWEDDGDGKRESDEPRVEGQKVQLVPTNDDKEPLNSIAETTTDENGHYTFNDEDFSDDYTNYKAYLPELKEGYSDLTLHGADGVGMSKNSDFFPEGDLERYTDGVVTCITTCGLIGDPAISAAAQSFTAANDGIALDAGLIKKDDGGEPSETTQPSETAGPSETAQPSETTGGPTTSNIVEPSETGGPTVTDTGAPTTTDDKGDNLPTTGAKLAGLIAGGIALVGGGIVLAIAARRRRTQLEE